MNVRPVHPFPARMAPDLALEALADLRRGSTVLDPMAGSGTVLRQAIDLGHKAIGFDMDPLAVLMSRVWTTSASPSDIRREQTLLLQEAMQVDLRSQKLPWVMDDAETSDFISYWFADNQRRAIHRIAYVLHRRRLARLGSRRRAAVDALAIALSRIVITKEQGASLARDTSHSRPHKVTDYSDFDVFLGFQRSVALVCERLGKCIPGAANVQLGDARKIPLRRRSVDAVITSPPYLNAIDYMRGHRMSLVWLGYRLCELRTIRATTIGAERAADIHIKPEVQDVAAAMCDVEALAPRQKRMVERYAGDLILMLSQVERVLKASGQATLVVGNSCLREVFVRNSEGVARAAELAGLNLIQVRERELPAGSRYLPMTLHGSLSKRMRTETVMSFAPAAQAH